MQTIINASPNAPKQIKRVLNREQQDHSVLNNGSLPLKTLANKLYGKFVSLVKPLKMKHKQLQVFFWQCTRLNFFALLLTFSILLLSEPVYKIHQHFYAGSLEDFQKMLYITLAAYKLLWLFFNVVPYLALRLTKKTD